MARKRDYDLTRWDDTERLFADVRPELVIHLAAEVGGIGANRDNPGRYWYANLMMGAHVLELARLHGTAKVVTLGTICEYPKFTPVPFREEDLWNGYPEETNAPYGVAKKSILVGAQTYRRQYGMHAIHLLPVNLYGPGDNFDLETSHVIPALIRKMLEAQERGEGEIVLWGDGSPTREFLYVEDAAEGIWLAAQRYDEPEPGQPRLRGRDLDPRPRPDRRGAHGLLRRDRLGRDEAERAAAPAAGRVPRGGAVRLPGAHDASGTGSSARSRGTGRTPRCMQAPRAVAGELAGAARRISLPRVLREHGVAIALGTLVARPVARDSRVRADRPPQRLALLPGRRPALDYTTAWLLGDGDLPFTAVGFALAVRACCRWLQPRARASSTGCRRSCCSTSSSCSRRRCWRCTGSARGSPDAPSDSPPRRCGWCCRGSPSRCSTQDYHEKYVEQFLPQAHGTHGDVRPRLDGRARGRRRFSRHARSSATTRGQARRPGSARASPSAVKPSVAIALPAFALALAVARRWRALGAAGLGLALPLVVLVVWKARGVGYLPRSRVGRLQVAAGADGVFAVETLRRLELRPAARLERDLRGEFFSVRLLELLALGGTSHSRAGRGAGAVLVGGWFVLDRAREGAVRSLASIDSGSLFRYVMPAFPAFCVLAAALLLLVPTLGGRLATQAATRLPSRRASIAIVTPARDAFAIACGRDRPRDAAPRRHPVVRATRRSRSSRSSRTSTRRSAPTAAASTSVGTRAPHERATPSTASSAAEGRVNAPRRCLHGRGRLGLLHALRPAASRRDARASLLGGDARAGPLGLPRRRRRRTGSTTDAGRSGRDQPAGRGDDDLALAPSRRRSFSSSSASRCASTVFWSARRETTVE